MCADHRTRGRGVARTIGLRINATSNGAKWGWFSLPTISCLVITILSAVAFVYVERRVAVPLLDLALLRNVVLVASTVAILIGSGTINGLMYLLSLYFQNHDSLGMTPLQAGLALLPATVGLVLVAPLVPKFAARIGGRQVVALGFLLTAVGFGAVGFVQSSWAYAVFVLPLIAIAVGMGLSNGPASSAATACVPEKQVGSASGVSNMARYIGAAVATALVATINASVIQTQTDDGAASSDALAAGLSVASWVMAIVSLVGVGVAVMLRRYQAERGTLQDAAASAAALAHTLPTSASGSAK